MAIVVMRQTRASCFKMSFLSKGSIAFVNAKRGLGNAGQQSA